jgi:hypothetical protein
MGTARRFIILAMLALIISTPARAQDDDDPLMQAAKQAGKGIGEYLGYKMSLEATILARRAELARCGSCPQREALERALAEAELQKGFSNAVEGAWLRSIGLEYDSFGEMLRAMWEDAGRRAERAREEDAERRLMFRLRQPVTLWCTLKRGSRDAGECTNEFFAKWARDLGEHTTSPTFGRRLQEQQWRIQAACFNSLLKLRVEAAGPRPADPPVPGRRRADNPRRTAATPVPPFGGDPRVRRADVGVGAVAK